MPLSVTPKPYDSSNVSVATNVKTESQSQMSVNKAKSAKVTTKYSSDRNKEKIELYAQKIQALLECLKRTGPGTDKKK